MTREEGCSIISERSRERGTSGPDESGLEKKFEKTSKKGLTNGKRSDIIYRLSARDRGQAKLLEN